MKIISTFNVTRLRVASHVNFHRAVHSAAFAAVFTNTVWAGTVGEYLAQIRVLDDVVRRPQGSIYTADIVDADALRDSTLSQLFLLIDAGAKSTVAAERDAGKKLQFVVKPYRKDGRDQLTDETEDIRGLIAALNEDRVFEWTETLVLGGVIQRLRQQNNAFDELYTTRAVDVETRTGGNINTPEQRKVVDALYRQLVNMANSMVVAAHAGVDTGFDAAKLDTFIDAVNALIEQYKVVLANQGKKQKKEEEDKDKKEGE